MNRPKLIHPRLFESLRPTFYDRQVQIEVPIETFDAANQPQTTYASAPGLPSYLDCRRGVMTAALAQSMERRTPEVTISADSEYIAIAGYYPQIVKTMRANIVGGQVWNITGVIFDSTRTQTYLIVDRVTADAGVGITE